ncbi:outer membrane lipid asymmetry maintenance protein MlaD [Oceanicella actignis]|uniref:Phospholipid/cholesterol/gamma-HCH transport system substrate-binding protein n=1 Tax=Oceanicella actignis TaxID=1189325 RepID=A0A1M7TG96_9RHOB|nr:outer membrane lipid asymmetry maintenance protein MlaD [Oceanicella actignis]TYO88512.1 phospholipid/cholesterol/gamma-HCH transport system substrate-binding protein [Oceanicella actignis]SET60314.1 phospholipid/cholesterol/gamma-HCH transport system substrate-binding protein [Oceanicella actignis]SHN69736.1 phospholipid/cholesterol/gamma-HCH transport system substrate-binding protein [Oceanicella actignis]
MANSAAETVIGAAVLLAAGGFFAYAAQTTGYELGGKAGVYELVAPFRKADGLAVGSDVRVAGVKVGSVAALELDLKTYRALARLAIDEKIKLPEDSDAAVATEGLLGGAYVAITPGSSDVMFENGDEIQYTQGSISILDLVGKAISAAGQ